MKAPQNVLQAALAGLLHDIGKFAQRAGDTVDKSWDQQSQQEFKYQHALHSWNFINRYVPDAWKSAVGAHHHRPQSDEEWFIRVADHLASGERISYNEQDDGQPQSHPKQLKPIFRSLRHLGGDAPKEEIYLPLNPLRLAKDALFPAGAWDENRVWQAYEHLWRDFCAEADNLKQAHSGGSGDLQCYLESMLQLLQRYAWCIPAAYFNNEPDISLYDHSRSTAALAAILVATNWTNEQKTQLQNDPFNADFPLALLVGGDISGIQDFIYTISSKGAARTLRGRSFYLQLLTEAVLRFVLAELGLPYTQVIYSGGGHFYLLAPLAAGGKLPAIQKDITLKMLKHHGVSLYLALGWSEVRVKDFKLGKFPGAWGQMGRQLVVIKNRRYAELGEDFYHQVFAIQPIGGEPEKDCSVCGEDHRQVNSWDLEREEQARICALCESFEEQFGKPLPQAKFIALGFTSPESSPLGSAKEALQEFGMQYQFMKASDEKVELPKAQGICLWALDDPEGEQWPSSPPAITARALHYTVNRVPPKSFEDLENEVQCGFVRLGVLRMDVDNLGQIFSKGLGNNASLSRLSSLSFQVSLFFDGWVKRLCEQDGRQQKVYSVYSGGDDLFLIAPWDIVPDLAMDIRQTFCEYIGNHPEVHLSGGMAFIHGKYPVYQAADDAGEAEKLAKGKPGKNAFTFLGEAWEWDEFRDLSAKKDRLLRLVGKKRDNPQNLEGPQSLLQVLQNLAQHEAKAARLRNRPVWGPWMWLGVYQLSRMGEQYETSNPALSKEILSLHNELEKDKYSQVHAWGVAARWAQFLSREKLNTKK